ncbi:MAG: hypothetical protein ACRDT8_01915 [Micromonosporaceae bacterium]
MSTTTSEITTDAESLLQLAHEVVASSRDGSEPLTQAALHLINCAAEAVGLLSRGDPDAAQQALGCARAAVTTATYALLHSHQDDRMEQP